jgi:hypothetical protein
MFLYSRNIKITSSTWACINIESCHFTSFDFMMVANLILIWHWLFEDVTWSTPHVWSIYTFGIQVTSFLDSIKIDIYWYMIIYSKLNSSDWTSTRPSSSHTVPRCQDSRLFFSDIWFIVAKSLLIILQFTILSHTSLHIFHRLILEKLLLMIKLLP